MQEFEASDDDVVSTNIDTTITPIRMGSLRLRSGTSVAPAPTAYATESKTPKLRLIPGLKGQYPCLFNRDQRHHDATRRVLTEPGMRPPVSKAHRMASQIAAVIPSRAIRRVAAIDDECRGLAAAIMRDQPVVVLNWFAGGT